MKISDVITSLFPDGYVDQAAVASPRAKTAVPRNPAHSVPFLCTDLFAITSVLLQRSGAYHHVAPDSHSSHAPRVLEVSPDDRDHWVALGEKWRGDDGRTQFKVPKGVEDLWNALWNERHADIYETLDVHSRPPAWWRLALALHCIADEAAQGLGYTPRPGRRSSFQALMIDRALTAVTSAASAQFSFSTAEPDVACVLPKSRTPLVGCTLRSLSHNLALLPPRGLARAYWIPYPDIPAGGDGEEGGSTVPEGALQCAAHSKDRLNCLLIPMPYRIAATSIVGVRNEDERWGWFDIRPEWCEGTDQFTPERQAQREGELDRFWDFVDGLIRTAESDVGEVHCVVFPEAALSSAVFRFLVDKLKQTNVELLIAGLFDHADKDGENFRHGNYAAMAAIGSAGLISYRQKHHRWRLDRDQIQTYALGASLDPNYGWWENIDILSRSLDVYVLRGSTTVTTLICEDLARHDPCQDLVRGIGPNLVFALLMDGPQLKARWPARYATVLAEDPGCSVLTFTSLGLIERSNATGLLPESRMIGLWRDDRGETVELNIPRDTHALCLTLQSTRFTEYTLDGRSDNDVSESWRMSGLQPVRAAPGTPGLQDVVAGRWTRSTP